MPKLADEDWSRIEPIYSAGIRSLADIGNEFGVTPAAILKRAKRDGWTKDLSARIKAKAEEKVNAALVNESVNEAKKVNDNAIVEANAEMQASIILSHRTDIQRSRKLVMTLLEELETETGSIELLRQLGDLMRASEVTDKLNELYHKIISLPSRSKNMKDLAESLKSLVGMEREAFGIDREGNKPTSLSEFLESLG